VAGSNPNILYVPPIPFGGLSQHYSIDIGRAGLKTLKMFRFSLTIAATKSYANFL